MKRIRVQMLPQVSALSIEIQDTHRDPAIRARILQEGVDMGEIVHVGPAERCWPACSEALLEIAHGALMDGDQKIIQYEDFERQCEKRLLALGRIVPQYCAAYRRRGMFMPLVEYTELLEHHILTLLLRKYLDYGPRTPRREWFLRELQQVMLEARIFHCRPDAVLDIFVLLTGQSGLLRAHLDLEALEGDWCMNYVFTWGLLAILNAHIDDAQAWVQSHLVRDQFQLEADDWQLMVRMQQREAHERHWVAGPPTPLQSWAPADTNTIGACARCGEASDVHCLSCRSWVCIDDDCGCVVLDNRVWVWLACPLLSTNQPMLGGVV